MPISNSYPKGIPIEDEDLFVGTKAYNNRTVNYTAQGVADYLNINSKVAIGGQMSFQFVTVPNVAKTIAFDGGGGDNTAFSAITKLIVSAIDLSTANITIFLNYLNNSQVLLSQQNQPNFFGHYKITGYTQIGTSDFYELDLEFIGGNGNIGDNQYYDLVSFVLSTEVPPTAWGTIIGDIEDQTDLINYISSQITIPTWQETLDVDFGVSNIVTTPFYYDDGIIKNSNDIFGLKTEQLTGDLLYSYLLQGQIGVANGVTGKSTSIDYDYGIQFYKVISSSAKSTYIKADNVINNNVIFQLPNKVTGTYTLATLNDIPTGGVTSVTSTSPITSSGGTTPVISTSMTTNKLIGRSTAGTGVMEEITIGTGLTLSGGTLNASSTGDSIYHGTASGTDTYTATISGPAAYNDGNAYLIRFTNGNTTGATLNINGLGAIPLYRNNDGPLLGGDILAGGEMLCIYNSTTNRFQVIGISPNSLIAYVTNDDSVTLTKGMPVYAFSGQGDRMTVKRANNTGDATSAQTVGLVLSTSIAVNQKGFIMMQGLLDGLSILPTSTWADGDPVYLGATAGTITNVKPHAPNHLVYLGVVTTASNGSAGRLYVRVQNGYELQELHNVDALNPNNNDGIFYNSITQLWEHKNVLSVAAERRNANNSTNSSINYCGIAPADSLESASVWTITRLTITLAGAVTTASAINVKWTDRETTIYT